MDDMQRLLDAQRAYYHEGDMRVSAARVEALKKLQTSIKRHEGRVLRALATDLGRAPEEAFMTEVGTVYAELTHALRRLKSWSRPRLVLPSRAQMHGYGQILREPYGVVLILSPWSSPFQMTVIPLIEAVAAGNCAVLRSSSNAPKTAAVLSGIIQESFRPVHVAMARCETDTAQTLWSMPFDKIFFAGSASVGHKVLQTASERLTPVTLALGGKCPAIVAADADITLAARRIVWAKCLGSGQSCVAPDYVLVAKRVENTFLQALHDQITAQYGQDPVHNHDLAAIVGDSHFERLTRLLQDGRLICGGQTDPQKSKIAPTVLTGVKDTDPVMQEEIFGPILPVLSFRTMEEALSRVRARPTPPALYLFTSDKAASRRVMRDAEFGGGCVNDCVQQMAVTRLPFGGAKESGMGTYLGKAGFECFSRPKPVFVASARMDPSLRYAPRKGKLPRLKRLYK